MNHRRSLSPNLVIVFLLKSKTEVVLVILFSLGSQKSKDQKKRILHRNKTLIRKPYLCYSPLHAPGTSNFTAETEEGRNKYELRSKAGWTQSISNTVPLVGC